MYRPASFSRDDPKALRALMDDRSFYVTAGQVPTWNYAVVHAHGAPHVLDDEAARAVLARLMERHEQPRPAPWPMTSLPEDDLASLLRAIVAFEMPVTRLEGKWKVGQNREPVDRQSAADHLATCDDPDARAIAAWMHAVDPGP